MESAGQSLLFASGAADPHLAQVNYPATLSRPGIVQNSRSLRMNEAFLTRSSWITFGTVTVRHREKSGVSIVRFRLRYLHRQVPTFGIVESEGAWGVCR